MTNPLRKYSPIKNPGTAASIIAVASSQITYSESGDNDTYFGKWYGLNNNAWCGMFVSWCAFVSGCTKIIPRFAYTPAGADWFKTRNQWHDKPRPGDIAFYDTAGLSRISHTGIVDKVFPDGSWTSIEGNTNAAGSREGRVVRRQKRRTTGSSRGGFGRPNYKTVPKTAQAPARKTVKEIAQEVVDGKWGTGAQRKERLQRAGYPVAAVQHAVNDLL